MISFELVVHAVLIVVLVHNTAINWRIGKREKALAERLEGIERCVWPSRFR